MLILVDLFFNIIFIIYILFILLIRFISYINYILFISYISHILFITYVKHFIICKIYLYKQAQFNKDRMRVFLTTPMTYS